MIFRASACLLALLPLSRLVAAEPPVPSPPAAAAATPAGPTAPLVPTVVESGAAEMVSTEKETTFTFRDGVVVTGTNLKLTCDHLEIIARRTGDPAATFGKQENFKSLVARGNVHIVQSDREATCERAEVFPGDDKVVLSGSPKVRSVDGQYQASGPKMILHRGERRAEIVGDGGERPRLTLPALKDLGYEKEKPKAPKAGATAPAAPPTPAPNAPASTEPRPITVPGITPASK
jgi:lipopolysaccharide export system protein LptA